MRKYCIIDCFCETKRKIENVYSNKARVQIEETADTKGRFIGGSCLGCNELLAEKAPK